MPRPPELHRCVKELGFVGALVNGFSKLGDEALYYDDKRYLPFWAEMESLAVPFYLHPRDPLPTGRATTRSSVV